MFSHTATMVALLTIPIILAVLLLIPIILTVRVFSSRTHALSLPTPPSFHTATTAPFHPAINASFHPASNTSFHPASPAPFHSANPSLLHANVLPAIGELKRRQAPAIPTALPSPTAPLQVPPVTTQWLETTIGAITTWVPITYTQTFGGVVDQWEGPAPGSIGMGTITGQVGVVKTVTSANGAGKVVLGMAVAF
ncbi:hypothetical protein EJ06DRAFT_567446 [Trichodelitschia bisporula]|uniref:Uncharacterized protein n=1 Tax=Trichodelitschia bisporula TaxID=703511 RepID=A0A6G1HL96_9PEZI|nr:hypothetical protein EJ06DRAFT_567446 [Trichodelitschia bisporula]